MFSPQARSGFYFPFAFASALFSSTHYVVCLLRYTPQA